MLCRYSIELFLVCLMHLNFTVDNYILKQKLMYHLSQVQSSIRLLIDFLIPYCKMLNILIYYTAILKEMILFEHYGSLRLSYLSHTHRLKSILRGNINYKAFHGIIICKGFVS